VERPRDIKKPTRRGEALITTVGWKEILRNKHEPVKDNSKSKALIIRKSGRMSHRQFVVGYISTAINEGEE